MRSTTMIPGEYLFDGPPLELNAGRPTCEVSVNNTGDRPVRTAARFEPGEVRTIRLVAMAGARILYGASGLVNGALDDEAVRQRAFERLEQWQRGELAVSPLAAPRKKPSDRKKKSRKK